MTQTQYESFFTELPSTFIRERRMHYLIVNAIAKRVRQLQLGERPLAVSSDGNREAIRVATLEFLEDSWKSLQRLWIFLRNQVNR